MEQAQTFDELENQHQSMYDDIQFEFKENVVVNVTLLRFRNISVSSFHDLLDTPDPQFRVTCPKVNKEELRTFSTYCIGDNVTSGEINQTFKFVDPKSTMNLLETEDFPIIIEVYDLDICYHDFIGKQEINATELKINSQPLQKTLIFEKNRGELDVIVNRELKVSPDFRFSLGLCPEEKSFRRKRMPIIQKAMESFLGEENRPVNQQETPVVSLVCSGGGFRAVTGMCGAMEALKDADLLDTITYTSGLSGSAWYLSSAYALEGMSSENQSTFHQGLKEKLSSNLLWNLISPSSLIAYEQYVHKAYKAYGKPHTFINYFPGYLVGKQLLGEKHQVHLSDLSSYIEDAKVPYPILVALHVKSSITAGNFHAYMERSPHEIYFPNYGIGFRPQHEGSIWSHGILVRERPEYPLDFTIGMTGCAFSILLNPFLRNGGENSDNLLSYIEQERINGRMHANKELDESQRSANVESDDDDLDVENEENETYSPACSNNHDNHRLSVHCVESYGDLVQKSEEAEKLHEGLRQNNLFSSRNALIGRTARINNFVLGFDQVKRYCLNPFGVPKIHEGEAKELIDAVGVSPIQKKISTTNTTLSFADAGILKNVPTDAVLRPQRTTDIMIVMDFNGYESDDSFNYAPLLSAAAHAWQSGLKFPNIDFKKVANLPPKDFLIFPSDEEGCPTVLWFTLSNKKFKNLREYNPRSKEKPPCDEKRNFNDFDVYGGDSFSSTFSFQYSNYNFDQLRELMYYNVKSHIQDIKATFISVINEKRQRVSKKAGV